jgi:hypothetical protein
MDNTETANTANASDTAHNDNARNDNAPTTNTATHRGSCHCGAVRFEVTADLARGASRCNCTVCSKIAILGVTVAPEALKVLSPEAELGQYEWGGRISRRYFCKQCGIHTFSRGFLAEVGGAYACVNVNTLDDIDPATLPVTYWDGRHDNWMAGTRGAPWPIFAVAAA